MEWFAATSAPFYSSAKARSSWPMLRRFRIALPIGVRKRNGCVYTRSTKMIYAAESACNAGFAFELGPS